MRICVTHLNQTILTHIARGTITVLLTSCFTSFDSSKQVNFFIMST